MNSDLRHRDRERVLEQLVSRTNEGFWFIDPTGSTLDVNPAMCRILQRPRDEVLGRPVYDFVDAENLDVFRREIAARRAGVNTGTYEIALLRPDGSNVPCINNASSVWDDDGRRIGSIGLWTDISRLKEVELQLREIRTTLEQRVADRTRELERSHKRLRRAHSIARLGSWEAHGDGAVDWSPEVFDLMGIDPADFDGRSATFYARLHPDDRASVSAATKAAWDTGKPYDCIHRVIMPNGDIRTLRESAEVICDDRGTVVKLSGTVQDITSQVEAEAQLRQAQKMEAIGQLTGGIAHDFNNLLAVIRGSAELLDRVDDTDNALVSSIVDAADRGASLTHRLLAYARKQPLRTSPVKIDALVSDLMEMLSRSLGEGVEIVYEAEPDLWTAFADPNQLKDSILNLAINARDAMTDGGLLTIAALNETIHAESEIQSPELAPGEYVVVQITDTGHGMSAETLAHATDPFFTTKRPGTGSGLGLSMVQGFAQQSHGGLFVESAAGRGTKVSLFLPRAAQDSEPRRAKDTGRAAKGGNGEAILVIEDDEHVRRMTERLLLTLNYEPVSAAGLSDARLALNGERGIDLILSDVVLRAGANGLRFADEVRESHPNVRMLFMSGYSDFEAFGEHKSLAEGILAKPFSRTEIATAVSKALASET